MTTSNTEDSANLAVAQESPEGPNHKQQENDRGKILVGTIGILMVGSAVWLLCSFFQFNSWVTIFEVAFQIINTFIVLLQFSSVQKALTSLPPASQNASSIARTIRPLWLSLARLIGRIPPIGSLTALAFLTVILFGVWNLWLCFYYHLEGWVLAFSLLLGMIAITTTLLWMPMTRKTIHKTARGITTSLTQKHRTTSNITTETPAAAAPTAEIVIPPTTDILVAEVPIIGTTPPARRRPGKWNIVLLVFLLFVSGFWNITLNRIADACSGAATQEITGGIGATIQGRECIGISDGSVAFDTNRPDGMLKSQAASTMRTSPHNITTAESLLIEALNKDPDDAEAAIYLEDLRIRSNPHHVTMVVETLLSGAYVSDGRNVLQGAAIEQKENNDRCNSAPDCIYLNILIANAGSGYIDEADYSGLIAEQILQAEHDPTLVGVMDGLSSQAALNINSILATAPHPLPIVAAKATTDYARGRYYFFRVTPFDLEEARLAADYIQNTLQARRIAILFRKENVFSGDLVQDLRGMFSQDQLVDVEQYQERDSGSIELALNNALAKKPDIIYCSCYASEVSVVLEHLPTTGPEAHLRVMGADAFYELGDYTPEAKSSLDRLLFTALAYPGAWQRFAPQAPLPAFFYDYDKQFRHNINDPLPTAGVITSYDAMQTLMEAATRAFVTSTEPVNPAKLYTALLTITGKGAIQGISGQIAFNAQGSSEGDPFQKAIFLLTFDTRGDVEYVDMCGQFLVNEPMRQACDT